MDLNCIFCGGVLAWGNDENASDVCDDYPTDDFAIMSSYTCMNCGRTYEIFEPTEEDKRTTYKDFWSNDK